MIDIPIAKTVSIREAGFDEYWLQDQIVNNPSALDLGDLEVISKEKIQFSGGRLDILLKDPEDDKMYEVEVMLGDTDETHIIRTIEYWDNEKENFRRDNTKLFWSPRNSQEDTSTSYNCSAMRFQ